MDRKAARARCNAATEGPWRTENMGNSHRGQVWSDGDGIEMLANVYCGAFSDGHGAANAEFIANARTDLPAALDLLDKIETVAAEWEAGDDCTCFAVALRGVLEAS